MSLQTRIARSVVRDLEAAWSDHLGPCGPCSSARRARFPLASLCPDGREIRAQLTEARRVLRESAQLDRLPVPGQAAMFGEHDATGLAGS